jgi:hypothetical protein
MIRKIVWSVLAVLVVAAAVASAYWQRMSLPLLQPQAVAPQMQVDNSVVGGSVANVSASSITVTKQDGTSATFSVTADTAIISRVSAGQTGKALSDLVKGTMVIIVPNPNNRFNAKSVAIVPPPPIAPSTAAGIPATFAGTVVSVSAAGFTLISQDNTSATVTMLNGTQIFSDVESGQNGKTKSDIKVGTLVQVSGTAGDKGIKAQSVFVANL